MGAGYKLFQKTCILSSICMASFVDYQQNPLFINILALFSFKIILLIQCLKAFNNTLGWKDPDSKEREDRNIVARAQPPLHRKGRAENKKQNHY